MLEIKNIVKNYAQKNVLKDVSIQLETGIYGLLGANGAGKTTLINIITGIIDADAGSIIYNGLDIHNKKSDYRKNMGFMPQYTTFYPNFTAKEFLEYMCVIKGIPKKQQKEKITDLLEKVNLTKEANTKIGTFSGGMRQRIGIAQALLNDPDVLILDEPTAGLDPGERIRFRNLISDISANRTVILATHIVQDIEYIANQVILLHEGNIMVQGKPNQLLTELKGKVGVITPDEQNLQDAMQKHVVSNLFSEDGQYRLRIVTNHENEEDMVLAEPNLEDLFLFFTQRSKNNRE